MWPGESLKIDVEYLNFIVNRVSADDVLAKHMDHKNDKRHWYNYSAICSYFVHNQEDLYRVTVVMTSRASVGSLVDRIRADRLILA